MAFHADFTIATGIPVYFCELPEFARFLDGLVAMPRLILFDKRGTGLSDRVAGMPALEQRADDIAEVMNAAGSARAAIAAWGEGAAIAAMFAATHPERVAALVLGSVPVKVTDGPGPPVVDNAVIEVLSAAVETAWGQASLVPLLAPSRADHARWARCSPPRDSGSPTAWRPGSRWTTAASWTPGIPAAGTSPRTRFGWGPSGK
jgi:pimeloyl-ACP methyl ester carboxylesterase